MASANLDLVRSIYAAWERGDYGADEWAHSEIEFVGVDGPDPGTSTGRPAMAEAWRSTLGPWEELRAEASEYRELDDERILVLVHWSGHGKTSGLELRQVQTKSASLFHLSGGKVTRLVLYWDGDRALTDLGLAPEAGSPGP